MENRLGSFEIDGKAYPLNYSVRIAQNVDAVAANKQEGAYGIYRQNVELLSLLLEDGAEFSRVILGEKVQAPTLEQLLLLLTPADNTRVVQAIRDALERGGMRLVKARAKKTRPKKPEQRGPGRCLASGMEGDFANPFPGILGVSHWACRGHDLCPPDYGRGRRGPGGEKRDRLRRRFHLGSSLTVLGGNGKASFHFWRCFYARIRHRPADRH